MLPDYFQDLRAVGFTKENMGLLYQGAEAYIRMWEKALQVSQSMIPQNAPADLDDQRSEAPTITVGANISGRIAFPSDVNLVEFTVSPPAPGTIKNWDFVVSLPAGSTLDSYLRLFNADGNELHANDDAGGGNRGSYIFHRFFFGQGGTYYVGVSGYRNQRYDAVTGQGDINGSTGDYTLIIRNLNP